MVRPHVLRRFGITALINEGVSPYKIWDEVRHKIPEMSEVIMMYNRPKTEDPIEAMEVIAKKIPSYSSKVKILLIGCLKFK